MDEDTKSDNESSHGDEIQATVDQLVHGLAEDYRNYLNFDVTKEQTKYYDSIEVMLTKLDEFCGLVDLIRSDTNLCLNTTLPKIDEKFVEMRHIFNRIDKLVQFVEIVKENVNVMEERVNQAEKDVGDSIGSGLMKKLSSIVGSKKSKEKRKIEYEEPVIFHTEDYFLKANRDIQTVEPSTETQQSTTIEEQQTASVSS